MKRWTIDLLVIITGDIRVLNVLSSALRFRLMLFIGLVFNNSVDLCLFQVPLKFWNKRFLLILFLQVQAKNAENRSHLVCFTKY